MDILYLELFGKAFVPERFRSSLRDYLYKAGVTEVPYKFFGALFWGTLIITYLIYFGLIFNNISDLGSLIILIATFGSWFLIQSLLAAVVIMAFYLYLNIEIYKRTKEIEENLPDYLTLVSTNLKGGLSFEKSLWAAIKPDFGILAKEMTLVSKKVLTGNDIGDSLDELGRKYESPTLRRSINLIMGELESGGKVVDVIDRVVKNLKKTVVLKEEMAAATVAYTIFMVAIVLFITPILFALSQQLLRIIIQVTTQLGGASTSGILPLSVGEASINPAEFRNFSIIAIGIISSFSAMIISIITRGDIRGGIKYIPVFIAFSITLFLVFGALLSKLFTGIV